MHASRPSTAARTITLGAGLAALALACTAVLSGCSAGWWVPSAGDETTEAVVVPTAEASDAFAPTSDAIPALDATVDEIPSSWNAIAAANGSGIELPDPIAADDTTDGLSTTTLTIGDNTVLVQWVADTGQLTLLELDGPVSGDITSSSIAGGAVALVAASLGLSEQDAQAFMGDLIQTGVDSSPDGSLISQFAQTGNANVTFDVSDGYGRVSASPIGQ